MKVTFELQVKLGKDFQTLRHLSGEVRGERPVAPLQPADFLMIHPLPPSFRRVLTEQTDIYESAQHVGVSYRIVDEEMFAAREDTNGGRPL